MSAPKVLITGAGSGLGAAMARRFAAAGYAVAITDIDPERAEAVWAELKATGTAGFFHKLDITRDADWNEFHDRVMAEWGGLDVLINNAGIAAAGTCEQTSLEDWQWVIDVDLMGVVRGCHHFLPLLREQARQGRHGYIINVASFAGISALPGICAYGTAKAGVISLSEHLRGELFDCGIGVSVVCPAFVRTNLLDGFRGVDPRQRETVLRWMDKSGVSAEDVANQVYEAMEHRRFLVLTHKQTRWAWLLKRWWPERYYREVARQGQQMRRRPA